MEAFHINRSVHKAKLSIGRNEYMVFIGLWIAIAIKNYFPGSICHLSRSRNNRSAMTAPRTSEYLQSSAPATFCHA